ncbi:MAG TPA: 4Fe-4S dicluster domain-containing protein [Anaerolineales bacterium]|nr:4Fe-4S dicluster domain-containing protein [Anaerolineales bacterium]
MPTRGSTRAALEVAECARAVSRRQFLRGGGAAVGLAALAALPLPIVLAQGSRTAAGQKAILIDTTRCTGCHECVVACKRENGQPMTWATDLSPDACTYVQKVRNSGVSVKRQCMHCVDPSCVSVCPVAALRKSKLGPVYYDASRCFGCRYCEMACPFQVPRFEWDELWPKITKCDMCLDRVEDGLLPSCVTACRFGTLTFGDRDEMLAEAHHRIAERPRTYVDHVYGEHELGGTCVLYLSSLPFEELGLHEMPEEAPPNHTWEDTVKLPWVMGLGAAFLTGAWLVTKNRGRASTEGEDHEGGGNS